MKYQGYPLTLKDVFKYALDAVGPERIVFGTDSSYFPRGYRSDVLMDQKNALDELAVSIDDQAKIFGGNLKGADEALLKDEVCSLSDEACSRFRRGLLTFRR